MTLVATHVKNHSLTVAHIFENDIKSLLCSCIQRLRYPRPLSEPSSEPPSDLDDEVEEEDEEEKETKEKPVFSVK